MNGIKRTHIVTVCMILFIMLLAFIPRSIELFSKNFVFGFDQGKHWLAAKSIVVDHTFPLIGDSVGGTGGFFQGPGWYYLLAVFYVLFSGNPYGGIVLMVIAGLSTVAGAFLLLRKYFGQTEAIFVSMLLAISPAIIIQSRFTWPPFIIPPLTILFLWTLYMGISKHRIYFFWTFFMCGLMGHFEIATALTLFIPSLIVTCIITRIQKIPLKHFLLAPLGFVLPLTPLVLFDLRHHFLNIRGILGMTTTLGHSTQAVTQGLNIHLSSFSSNLFGAYETIPHPWFIFIVLHIAILLLIVLNRAVSREKKLFLISLITIPLMIFFEFMGMHTQLWEWWLLELPVMYIVLTGCLLAWIWKKHVSGKIVVSVILVYFLVLYGQHTAQYYRKDFNDFGGTQKIKGKVQAIQYIFNDAQGKPFGLLVFTPPVYTYPYDFVAWWLGTKTYNYVPVAEKSPLFYLLIEPDGEKPWSYKGWIETVVKTGTVEWQKTLPSGFIVEKRTLP